MWNKELLTEPFDKILFPLAGYAGILVALSDRGWILWFFAILFAPFIVAKSLQYFGTLVSDKDKDNKRKHLETR
jgi:hypothetical protein